MRLSAGGTVRRRTFLAVTGAAALSPVWVRSQPQATTPKIAVLLIGGREPFLGLFHEGLREHGYIAGQNITLVIRSSEGQGGRLPALAKELTELKPDVIVASETPAVAAARQATSTIPIVIAAAGDPVATGLIASLSRPGGNITGLSAATAEIAGKTLELIREIKPQTKRVAVMALAGNLLTKPFLEQIENAAGALAVEIRLAPVRGADDFESAFATMAAEATDALIMQPSVPYARAIELALRHRLPAVSVSRSFAEAGGLLSYAGNLTERYRGAATYVAEILKGRKPADLPVGQPTKFELVINLKTARTLGLEIPARLLARTDEVIE
jgi:putative ABC transport system substrate-binding protein